MTLQDHTRSIISLSWSRILGLGDDALLNGSTRLEMSLMEGSEVSFLRLFDHSILSAPAAVLDELRGLSDSELAEERCLLDAALRHGEGARSLGSTQLFYAEEPPVLDPAEVGAVSFDASHVQSVLAASPADDVLASGIAEADWSAALVDEDTGEASGAAGRAVWSGMLADLVVLTIPARRRGGRAHQLAAVAAEEAFVEGLIPQWRAPADSASAGKIARRLGFTQAGTQTSVVFG